MAGTLWLIDSTTATAVTTASLAAYSGTPRGVWYDGRHYWIITDDTLNIFTWIGDTLTLINSYTSLQSSLTGFQGFTGICGNNERIFIAYTTINTIPPLVVTRRVAVYDIGSLNFVSSPSALTSIGTLGTWNDLTWNGKYLVLVSVRSTTPQSTDYVLFDFTRNKTIATYSKSGVGRTTVCYAGNHYYSTIGRGKLSALYPHDTTGGAPFKAIYQNEGVYNTSSAEGICAVTESKTLCDYRQNEWNYKYVAIVARN
jgi:hypothetical protein